MGTLRTMNRRTGGCSLIVCCFYLTLALPRLCRADLLDMYKSQVSEASKKLEDQYQQVIVHGTEAAYDSDGKLKWVAKVSFFRQGDEVRKDKDITTASSQDLKPHSLDTFAGVPAKWFTCSKRAGRDEYAVQAFKTNDPADFWLHAHFGCAPLFAATYVGDKRIADYVHESSVKLNSAQLQDLDGESVVTISATQTAESGRTVPVFLYYRQIDWAFKGWSAYVLPNGPGKDAPYLSQEVRVSYVLPTSPVIKSVKTWWKNTKKPVLNQNGDYFECDEVVFSPTDSASFKIESLGLEEPKSPTIKSRISWISINVAIVCGVIAFLLFKKRRSPAEQ